MDEFTILWIDSILENITVFLLFNGIMITFIHFQIKEGRYGRHITSLNTSFKPINIVSGSEFLIRFKSLTGNSGKGFHVSWRRKYILYTSNYLITICKCICSSFYFLHYVLTNKWKKGHTVMLFTKVTRRVSIADQELHNPIETS